MLQFLDSRMVPVHTGLNDVDTVLKSKPLNEFGFCCGSDQCLLAEDISDTARDTGANLLSVLIGPCTEDNTIDIWVLEHSLYGAIAGISAVPSHPRLSPVHIDITRTDNVHTGQLSRRCRVDV